MNSELEDSGVRLAPRGRVFLVGAGPGDPELLTMRAHRLLTTAAVVAYDELVGSQILALVPRGAELLAVGRRRGTHPEAPSIDPRVLERALQGLDVVRLKGGDPMIFGRGGEEAEQLQALRIPFEIVPGVSAALGAAAHTGIPLTHRDAASSVTFVTAHKRHDASGEAGDDLVSRVPRLGTVVLYMGLTTLPETARALVAAGRAPTTPVAVVSHATLATQREVISDLANVAEAVALARLEAPALVIVGDVVSHRTLPSVLAASGLRPSESHGTSSRRSLSATAP